MKILQVFSREAIKWNVKAINNKHKKGWQAVWYNSIFPIADFIIINTWVVIWLGINSVVSIYQHKESYLRLL